MKIFHPLACTRLASKMRVVRVESTGCRFKRHCTHLLPGPVSGSYGTGRPSGQSVRTVSTISDLPKASWLRPAQRRLSTETASPSRVRTVLRPTFESMGTTPFDRLWIEVFDTANVSAACRVLMVPSRTASTAAAAFSGSTGSRLMVCSYQSLAQGTKKGQKWGLGCVTNRISAILLLLIVPLVSFREAQVQGAQLKLSYALDGVVCEEISLDKVRCT